MVAGSSKGISLRQSLFRFGMFFLTKKTQTARIEEADAKEEEYQSQSYVQSAALYFLEEAVSWLWQN